MDYPRPVVYGGLLLSVLVGIFLVARSTRFQISVYTPSRSQRPRRQPIRSSVSQRCPQTRHLSALPFTHFTCPRHLFTGIGTKTARHTGISATQNQHAVFTIKQRA